MALLSKYSLVALFLGWTNLARLVAADCQTPNYVVHSSKLAVLCN